MSGARFTVLSGAAARMERAKELLLEGVQVQEVTYELGYKDRPYFSELFKKHTGKTPTEFRQQYDTFTQ